MGQDVAIVRDAHDRPNLSGAATGLGEAVPDLNLWRFSFKHHYFPQLSRSSVHAGHRTEKMHVGKGRNGNDPSFLALAIVFDLRVRNAKGGRPHPRHFPCHARRIPGFDKALADPHEWRLPPEHHHPCLLSEMGPHRPRNGIIAAQLDLSVVSIFGHRLSDRRGSPYGRTPHFGKILRLIQLRAHI
ncbi:MAG: hypothetical protein H7Z12_17980 [Rhodospirillaceae bacterium]|nr:hypothetical protein [Rhodospirillales bacterium]